MTHVDSSPGAAWSGGAGASAAGAGASATTTAEGLLLTICVVLLGDKDCLSAQSRFLLFLPFFSGCDTTLLGGARDFSNAL